MKLRLFRTRTASRGLQNPSSGHGQSETAGLDDVNLNVAELSEDEHEQETPPRVTGFAWFLVVLAVLLATFLFALDTTIVADIQPAIIEEFGHIESLPWISVAFAASGTGTCLLWGKLFGLYNIKTLFIGSVILFEAGSALCGAAPSMNAFIVGRAICGVGSMGIYLGTMNILSVFTKVSERPKAISYMALMWGLGTVLGPILGGVFVNSSARWRWSFYVNLCAGVAAAPVYVILLPPHRPQDRLSYSEGLRSLDWIGSILFLGAVMTIFMAISFGGALYSWGSPQIISLLWCAGLLWLLFGLQQGNTFLTSRDTQIFPWSFVTDWEMCIFFAQTAAANTASFVPIYFIPLYFQFAHGTTALQAGVYLLPFVAFFVATILANGVIMARTGLYMPWYLVGGLLTLAGGALLYTIDVDSSPARTYGYSIILAIGGGAYNQVSFTVAQAKAAKSSLAQAVSFIICAQMVGITLALALSNAIFLNVATNKLVSLLPNQTLQMVQSTISGTNRELIDSLPTETQHMLLAAIVVGMKDTYILVMVAGCLVLILSLFMKRERLFHAAQK